MARIDPVFSEVHESATLAINERARAMRSAGATVHHFGFGESPFPVPAPMREALIAHAGEKGYLPCEGLPALRHAAARFLTEQRSTPFAPEEIFVGPGSKELLYDLFAILDGPVLVPAPAWVSYGPQATLLRKRFVPIPTHREHGYRLRAEDLRAACRQHEGQKLLVLNSPGNPTGTIHDRATLTALAEVCREEDVIVIADEIYALIDFRRTESVSMARLLPERTIVTTGLSKMFAAGGWRLGIAAVPEALGAVHAPLRAMISETFSAVAAPIQHAAIPAFEYGPEIRAHVERAAEIHGAASSYVHGRFLAMGLDCPTPEGAFYLFPDFRRLRERLARNGIGDSKTLCVRLLEEAQLALLPSEAFFAAGSELAVRAAAVAFDGATLLDDHRRDAPAAAHFPALVAGCDALERFLEELPA
ncbi:MAG: aminotransferase class I/II-fold pyridoxal phosphate-dependent enzyme [Pseudomonadales bacterium]|nr:aminotransferase class I/II-fold pyridoxal phosphate-dependent enzyme [Pseudomonadales bacterium]